MKSLLYIIALILPLYLVSCDKEETPEGNGDGDGTEQPGDGNGNGEDPKPEEPEYDPETQVYVAGLIWDKYSAIAHCTFEEGEEAAAKEGKRIPTRQEWTALRETSFTLDTDLVGYWYGEDSELLSESKKSIFLRANGYILVNGSGNIISEGTIGEYWTYSEKGEKNFFMSYGISPVGGTKEIIYSGFSSTTTLVTAHFVQDIKE